MKYYVQKLKDDHGEYEVHREGCRHLTKEGNYHYLGNFAGCCSAIAVAIVEGYTPANGCDYCCHSCHW